MNIIKRRRKVTKPDGTVETRTSAHWYVQWKDANGRTQRRKGYTDRAATRQLAAKLEREQARSEVGMTDPYAEHRHRDIREHLADYLDHLDTVGRSASYRELAEQRVGIILDGTGWLTLDKVNADDFLTWRTRRARNGSTNGKGIKPGAKPSARTLNHFRDSIRAFLNWCVSVKRMPANPLAGIPAVEGPEKVKRRAMTEAEITALLTGCPDDRRFAWMFLLLTGLRCREAAALEWQDVRLMATRPYLQLRQETTKARRADRVWLRPELVATLREKAQGSPKPSAKVCSRTSRR
ncbi:MAG: tyrosine-type recombinase/integrase [Planctomycetota bacterium]